MYALPEAAVRRSSKMGFLKFCNIHRKTLLLINFTKKRVQDRWFSVNIAKFLRTFIEQLQWLLLPCPRCICIFALHKLTLYHLKDQNFHFFHAIFLSHYAFLKHADYYKVKRFYFFKLFHSSDILHFAFEHFFT